MKIRSRRRKVAAAAITMAVGGIGLIGVIPAEAAQPTPAKAYDFDGDGLQDLALGSPYGDVGSAANAGFISVVYGSASGLNTARHSVINQNSPGIPGAVEANDQFGYAVASADFNRDGFADLAVGIPGEDTGNGVDAGLDTIIWGTSSGLANVATDGVEPTDPAAGHLYGTAMTTGDLDDDGATDLIVTASGTPDFYWFGFPETTAATAARSHGKARAANMRKSLAQRAAAAATPGVNAFYVAAGDVTGDDIDDLAVGVRDDDAFLPEAKAGVTLFKGSSVAGLEPGATIATEGISSVAVGDFQGDGNADVAVGQVGDSPSLGGRVTVLRGSANGISPGDSYFRAQGAGIPGTAATGDGYGWSLAAGDANGDGRADLAVGAPLKNAGTLNDAGAGAMLYGNATDLTGGTAFTQDTGPIPGTAEAGDQAGYHVSLINHNSGNFADLSIGVPRENGYEGYVVVLPGTNTGITPTGSIGFGTGVLGVSGTTAQIGLRIGRL